MPATAPVLEDPFDEDEEDEDDEGEGLIALPGPAGGPVCRMCGCTDNNACIGRDGEPCHWVTPTLCSVCLEL